MRIWWLALAFLTLGSVRAAAQEESRWLIVMVSGADDASNQLCAASLGFEIAPDKVYDGIYYVSDSSCGITGELTPSAFGSLLFQLNFKFKVFENDNGIWLSAATDAMRYRKGRSSGQSERAMVEKQLLLDQKAPIGSFLLEDGRQVNVAVMVSAKCAPAVTDCGDNAVTLVSSVSNQGKSYAHWRSTQKLLTESMQFFSNPAMLVGVRTNTNNLEYQVQILMPGALEGMRKSTPCQIQFQRAYRISTHDPKNPGKQVMVSYASKNTKDIVLEPGKELRLVFPPDTPSVQGYDIEDTLIIVPR